MYDVEAVRTESRQELPAALGGLRGSRGGTYNLTVLVDLDADGDYRDSVFIAPASAAFEVYPVGTGVGVGAL